MVAGQMQNLIKLLNNILGNTTFSEEKRGTITLPEFRILRARDRELGGLTSFLYDPNVPEDLLELLVRELEQVMHKFINSQNKRIGNGMVKIMGGQLAPTIDEFSRDLVGAAAVLGPERVLTLVFGWVEGEPLRYNRKAMLTGLSIKKSISLVEGVSISELPKSSTELYKLLPPGSQWNIPFQEAGGCTLLSIVCEASPAFFKPTDNLEGSDNLQHKLANGNLPNLTIDNLCEALSLACNNSVSWKYIWSDFQELQEFNSMWGGLSYKVVPKFAKTTSLNCSHLIQVCDIHMVRNNSAVSNPRVDTAISRWIESKQSTNLSDQFIDLRIALEALYLQGDFGELKFRLSTYGAWHLGSDQFERRNIYSTLQKAYDLASKAVHAGLIKNTPDNKNVLSNAQDICRDGILKTIKEGQQPSWTNLILGDVE